MAPNVNNPVRWAWWLGIEWLVKLRFGDKSKNGRGICSNVRYIALLYCLAVQVSFFFLIYLHTANTSQSKYYKGDCLEVEESQGRIRSRPSDREILCETTEGDSHSYMYTGRYSSLV